MIFKHFKSNNVSINYQSMKTREHFLKRLISSYDVKLGNRSLSGEEKVLFNSFIDQFVSAPNRRIIYRGDNNLRKQYNIDITSSDLLAEYIFLVGMKGKYFLHKEYKFELMDTEDDIFIHIFNHIHDKICNCSYDNPRTREKITYFLKDNPKIQEFFSTKANINQFQKIIQSISPEKKAAVKDYYFSLFHTINSSGSYFLSSSTSMDIANKFCSDGIVLIGWLPSKDLKNKTIEYNEIYKINEEISRIKLPTYTKPVYPEQQEICLKCGMLPHYIIGFIASSAFIINPAILKDMKSSDCSISDIIINGLNIDQRDFFKRLKETNYCHAYVFDNGQYYSSPMS